jgi:hypothetical protein
MVSVNLVANTDLRNADDFRKMVIKQQNGVVVRLGEIADVQLGAENYDSDVRFNGETATFMGIWVLPTANSLEVIKNVRTTLPGIQSQLPTGMKLGVPYDRRRGDLSIPRIVPVSLNSSDCHPDFADRSCLSHAHGGIHDQPADLAGDRALGRTSGG